jgi:hypothetical protein
MRSLLVLTSLILSVTARAEDVNMSAADDPSVLCASVPWTKLTLKDNSTLYRLEFAFPPAGALPDLLSLTLDRRNNQLAFRLLVLADRDAQRVLARGDTTAWLSAGAAEPQPVPLTPDEGEVEPKGKVIAKYLRYDIPLDLAKDISRSGLASIRLGDEAEIGFKLDPIIADRLRRTVACATGVADPMAPVTPTEEETNLDAPRIGEEPLAPPPADPPPTESPDPTAPPEAVPSDDPTPPPDEAAPDPDAPPAP